MQGYAVCNTNTRINSYVCVKETALSDNDVILNHAPRADNRTGADLRELSNNSISAHRAIRGKLRAQSNTRRRVNAASNGPRRVKNANYQCCRHTPIHHAYDSAALGIRKI